MKLGRLFSFRAVSSYLANYLVFLVVVCLVQTEPKFWVLLLAEATRPYIEELNLPQFLHLKADLPDGKLVILDARSASEFADGHIPQAKLYTSSNDLEVVNANGLTLVIYCKNDFCSRSSFLAQRMARNGMRNIKVYVGGWDEWIFASQPIALH